MRSYELMINQDMDFDEIFDEIGLLLKDMTIKDNSEYRWIRADYIGVN